jgi:hypothetical protein
MAKASRNNSATARLQPADFPVPQRLSQEKVSEICEAFRLSGQRAAQLKEFLDELVNTLQAWMPRSEQPADRQGDRVRLTKMRDGIAAARHRLEGLGVDGRLAVRSTAAKLADIVSGDWLRYHFPGDAPTRTRLLLLRGVPHERVDEKRSNYQFIQGRAPKTVDALLRDLEAVLTSAVATLDSEPGARGGLQLIECRQVTIVNLGRIWRQIGKKVVGTPKSDFVAFCHFVFEAMGWPTDGLVRAIPTAFKNYLNRQQKRARLRK